MPDEKEDLLRTLYELNEHYHDVKERVVWLAGVIYLTFSVALIAWYLENKEVLSEHQLPTRQIAIFLTIVFVLTAIFIFRQTGHKPRPQHRNSWKRSVPTHTVRREWPGKRKKPGRSRFERVSKRSRSRSSRSQLSI